MFSVDGSRVILDEYAGIPGSDYINANYIKGASGSMAYIASQGPLPHTVNDFWRMIVQCEVKVIVMACNEKESGKVKLVSVNFLQHSNSASLHVSLHLSKIYPVVQTKLFILKKKINQI